MQDSINLFENNAIKESSDRINELISLIRKYDDAYYNQATSLISDREYDMLFAELSALEKQFPQLQYADSPTQRIGGNPLSEFETFVHTKPMLSLSNTYSKEEVVDFNRRVSEILEESVFQYVCELKYDGVALSMHYLDGKLSVAATRGDGFRGDNITENVKTIRSLPLKVNPIEINGKLLKNFEVRGEVYMTEQEFLRINTEKEDLGEKTYANPRNLTAGTLKLLDSKTTAKRKLDIVCYYLDSDDVELNSHHNNIQILKRMGFPIGKEIKLCDELEDVYTFINEWEKKRRELEFQIDGIVIKIDSLKQQNELGMVARSPRWAIAYKYEAEKAQTRLNDIVLQVGRVGTVTPVAVLEPVLLAGSTISRATLHNADYIAKLDIRIGDTVIVEKGGDVIPKVSGFIKEARPNDAKPYIFPDICPCELKSPLHRPDGEAAYFCDNPNCPWQIRKRLEHFASRNAMDIEGFGEKVVELFVEKGFVKNIADIYNLKFLRTEIAKLDRWGQKSTDNLLDAIEKSKARPLANVIFALGIRFIGEGAAKILAKHFRSINKLATATRDELTNIRDIGNKMADSIILFFAENSNIEILDRLKAAGLTFEEDFDVFIQVEKKLNGLVFILTGELNSMTRRDAKEKIESLGGKVTSAVSKKTNFVIVGDNPGSKLDKAIELGVKIIDEAEFLKIIEI